MAETDSFEQGSGTGGAVPPRRLSPEDIESIEESIGIIESEFSVAMGRADRVRAACDNLRKTLVTVLPGNGRQYLDRLTPLLGKRGGAVAEPLFVFLMEAAEMAAAPGPIVRGLVGTRSRPRLLQVFGLARKLAEVGTLEVDLPLAEAIASRLDGDEALAEERALIEKVGDLLRHMSLSGEETGDRGELERVYLGEAASCASCRDSAEGERRPSLGLRRLIARILDAPGQPAPAALAERMVGAEAYDFLAPYFAYTRATHADLLAISEKTGETPPSVASLKRVEARHGEAMLRLILAELGWPRVSLGLEVRPYVGVSIGGAFPLLLTPAEAAFFEAYDSAERSFERSLVVAHGGMLAEETVHRDDDPVARFRAYNLRHAEALGDILDLSELTHAKVERVLKRMELIAHDYVALFSAYSDECGDLPRVYNELREEIERELDKAPKDRPLSAELTRLVQMFEEPGRLTEVRTMHGLKRYLHQKGLRLGFRLVESGRATNRTVDLLVVTADRVFCRAKPLDYVNFEPPSRDENSAMRGANAETGDALLPYPVEVVVAGFGRQMLHGQAKLPGMRIFCYGNEIHYYASFGNHPAFIRIDYAPPHRGGMIDVEYFGVSKYQLEDHPAPELDNIQILFRAMEFDASVAQTRIHTRYDKERALDMGDLCEKVEHLFCIVPYMMEVDWVIGSLDVNELAFPQVATHWADFLVRWGVLPIDQFLTEDRRGILAGIEPGPAGPREIRWDASEGSYRDRFTVDLPDDFAAWLQGALEQRGLGFLSWVGGDLQRTFGQNTLGTLLLKPLRLAVARGEAVVGKDGAIRAASAQRFRHEHPARRFAEILAATDSQRLAECMSMAAVAAPLERWLRFQTLGTIHGYEVQSAPLTLRGGVLTLYVLRDADGIIRLAFFVRGHTLFSHRESESAPWVDNLCCDVSAFEAVLRRNNYLSDAVCSPEVAPLAADEGKAETVRRRFEMPNPTPVWKTIPGDRRVRGLKASPGRAVGIALFGTSGRTPKGFEGAVLVAPAIRPNEDAFLYRAAAIVSTGGGILSHTGLMAIQFKKPALIVSGRWAQDASGASVLHYPVVAYEQADEQIGGFSVCMRSDFRQREDTLYEGDLVVVDADEGTLRVLGQDHDALALYDGLRQLEEIGGRLAEAAMDSADSDVLTLRGRRLRALHSLEKLLGRLRDPVLARHAVNELLLPSGPMDHRANRQEKTRLLGLLLLGEDTHVAERAKGDVVEIAGRLMDRHATQCVDAARLLPVSEDLYEILSLRLMVLRMRDTLREVAVSLEACDIELEGRATEGAARVEDVANRRLLEYRRRLTGEIAEMAGQPERLSTLRFRLHQMLRLDAILHTPTRLCAMSDGLRVRLAEEDKGALRRCAAQQIVQPADGGLELLPVIGSKAANLATIGEVLGQELVPAWFVVTDHALREALELPIPEPARGSRRPALSGETMGEGIEQILSKAGLTDGQKATAIAELWASAELPEGLTEAVTGAYRQLSIGEDPDTDSLEDARRPFVAIRSSAREEDTELATRAGEFDTFLFVRGEAALVSYLKRAWSSLWTARAIHNRAVLGVDPLEVGGGVLVQRMVWSRVSGVLQTVNTAEGMLREMVINAGLGLGEGVVSGAVAADQIVVAKESIHENAPLSIRYSTADKQEQVLFDERQGRGTARMDTLYHQRLRPALEYIEIQELVHAAVRLEAAYGYPLDIEFGIEGAHLQILQARPLATFNATLQETIDRYPIVVPDHENGGPPIEEDTP